MYKVLIAEDETVVREGIQKAVDFETLGYTLTGAYENGKQAIQAIREQKPDLVITDICMPVLDGIAVAEYIYQNAPEIRTVLLTGYSDFEYARKAIQFQVYEYVLKPISAKQLRNLLSKVKQELDIEKHRKTQLTKLEQELYVSQEIVREHYLNQLITEPQADVEKKFQELSIEFDTDSTNAAAMLVVIDDIRTAEKKYAMTNELLQYALCNICRDLCVGKGLVFRTESLRVVILLKNRNDAGVLAEEIQKTISSIFQFTASVYIGNSAEHIGKISTSYAEAMYVKSYKQMFSPESVIYADSIGAGKHVLDFHTRKYGAKIIDAVKLGQEEKAIELINSMTADMRAFLLSYTRINFYHHNMVANMIDMIEETTQTNADALKQYKIIDLDENTSFECVERCLAAFVKICISYLETQKGGISKQYIEKALQYIRENYWDKDVSLTKICAYLSVSTSYFSTLFKNHTGVTFVEYLTRTRIEKAKDLLVTTDLKSYEIAEKTGYADPHYFSVIFKKNTGLSPKEYREKNETK